MTAARPWKNWNTPTVARMTPAKTVSPPAHAFLVPDAGPVGAGWSVGDDVWAADGEVIGCFSFALSGRRRNSSRPAGEPLVEGGCHVGLVVERTVDRPPGARVGGAAQDTRYPVNEPDTRHRAEKAISSAPQMRDRPNQSVITVHPIGSVCSDSTACPAENITFRNQSSDHPTRSWLRLPRSGCPRARGPMSRPRPQGLALQRVQAPAPQAE